LIILSCVRILACPSILIFTFFHFFVFLFSWAWSCP
jgi:hypothetical protein